jgi:hypothetical protein
VDFSNEPLLCYYSDIYRDNFPVDTHGQLWVIDFQETGVLPASFMSFALRQHPLHPLRSPIIKTIPLPKSSNLGAMGRASYVLKVVHNTFRTLEALVSLIAPFDVQSYSQMSIPRHSATK